MVAKDAVRLAHHEAGHAVVIARLLGLERLGTVKLWESEQFGAVRASGSVDHPGNGASHAELATIHFAGAAAGWLHEPRDDWAASCDGDLERARTYALAEAGADESAAREWYGARWIEAVAIVRAEWPTVSRIAVALLKRRELTGDQVRALLDSAPEVPPAPWAGAEGRALKAGLRELAEVLRESRNRGVRLAA